MSDFDSMLSQIVSETNAENAHFWDEDDFVPATDAEMRAGMRDAMQKFAHLLPKEDTCECLTCASFRGWLSRPEAASDDSC